MAEYVIYEKSSGKPLQVHVEPEGEDERDQESVAEEVLGGLGRDRAPDDVVVAPLREDADLPESLRDLLRRHKAGREIPASGHFGGGGGGAHGSKPPATPIKPVFKRGLDFREDT